LDPLTLLMSSHFPSLVKSLEEWADVVIFDAPPMMGVSDVSVLASHCDTSLLVVAHGMTTRAQVKQASDFLREHQEFNVLGVVVNQAKLYDRSTNYYQQERKLSLPWVGKVRDRLVGVTGTTKLLGDGSMRLISLSEAAETLGITPAMARRWRKSGRLPTVKKGLRYWVRQDDLQALIDMETAGSTRQSLPTDGREGLASTSLDGASESIPQIPWSEER
jgi:hypothetical protein